ncbi:TPA: hypothetical protein AB5F24_001856 [Vibrio cholerae]
MLASPPPVSQMQVSRQILANLAKAARFKVIDGLLHQKALHIQSIDNEPLG